MRCPMDPAPMTTITFFIGDPQNSIMTLMASRSFIARSFIPRGRYCFPPYCSSVTLSIH